MGVHGMFGRDDFTESFCRKESDRTRLEARGCDIVKNSYFLTRFLHNSVAGQGICESLAV